MILRGRGLRGRGELVLDLGCSTGGLTQQIAELVGPGGRAVGIDPDAARIALARSTARAQLEFLGRAAEILGGVALDRPFDLAFSNFVFHWIRDKQAALRRVRGLLGPAGRIVIQGVLSLPVLVAERSRRTDPSGKAIFWNFAFEDAAALARHVEGTGLPLIRLGSRMAPRLSDARRAAHLMARDGARPVRPAGHRSPRRAGGSPSSTAMVARSCCARRSAGSRRGPPRRARGRGG